MFAILVLNSLMVFLEVLLLQSMFLLVYLMPEHQNIKASMQNSPKGVMGANQRVESLSTNGGYLR